MRNGSWDFLLCISPVTQVTFPYIAGPTLAAELKSNGIGCRIEDANIALLRHIGGNGATRSSAEDVDRWHAVYERMDPFAIDDRFTDEWIGQNITDTPGAVGFSVTCARALPWTLRTATLIKAVLPAKRVVLGGAFFDLQTAKRIHACCPAVDAIAVGEADSTIVEYVLALRANDEDRARRIPGLTCREANGLVAFEWRALSATTVLSTPSADFSDLPLDEYLDYRAGTRILPILGSRGCVGQCAFCTEPIIWNGFRRRPPAVIAAEMEHQIQHHGTKVFRFNDSMLNAVPVHLTDLCAVLGERHIEAEWAGNVRISPNLSPTLLGNMRRAGCRQLWFGLESGSPRMLRIMRKPTDLGLAQRIFRDAKEAGIGVLVFLISDFPGERLADTYATLEFLQANADYIDHIHVSEYKLLNHSQMYVNPARYGLEVEGQDRLGQPIWATTSHTVHNHSILRDYSLRHTGNSQSPWRVVGGM